MDNNELNRRLRYALRIDDAEALRLAALGGERATPDDVARWRLRDDAEGFVACPDAALLALLDGLVIDRRGPPADDAPPPAVRRVDNNVALKRLRIALSLRTDDVVRLIAAGSDGGGTGDDGGGGHDDHASDAGDVGAGGEKGDGGTLSESEVGSLFRKPGTRNFRRCGDQVLRRFLAGVALARDDRSAREPSAAASTRRLDGPLDSRQDDS